MLSNITGTPEVAPATSRASRDEQSRRNAAARRKLEALLENKRLHVHITDVWDQSAGNERGRQ